MMTNIESMPVGEIVANDYRAATILKSHKIDFCCQGGTSLAQACEKKKVSIWEVLNQLEHLDAQEDGQIDFRQWSADLLCDYIEKKHHRYVRKRAMEIPPFLEKVARVHGNGHPELLTIRDLFLEAVSNLKLHLEKEENDLFPRIRKMVEEGNDAHAEVYENLLQQLQDEHKQEGERFARIAELSNNYNPPQGACNTFKVSYALLSEFEEDLHKHIHLENNILFSKIRHLQNKAVGNTR